MLIISSPLEYILSSFRLILFLNSIVKDFQENPVGSLVTVRVNPWNLENIVLLGDAAHAVVPFYGIELCYPLIYNGLFNLFVSSLIGSGPV